MKKLIIVTGYESSASVFTSKVISHVFGKCPNLGDWNGMGMHGSKGDDVIIIHRSMPYRDIVHGKKWIDDLHIEIKNLYNYQRSYVICTRDLNISKSSRLRRFGGNLEICNNDDKKTNEIFSSLIESESKRTFIFNLETAIALKYTYYNLLYKWLGVESDFSPPIYDANAPYIK